MTGEEILNLTRHHAGDDLLSDYTEIERALRAYCQTTTYQWLREIRDGAFTFKSGIVAYLMGEQGFRRIERIWVTSNEDGKDYPLDEQDPLAFEDRVRDALDSSGAAEPGRPKYYRLDAVDGAMRLRLDREPDADYQARIDGIVDTPKVSRTQQLPGPQEHHEKVALLAAGYILQREGRVRMKNANSEGMMAAAAGLSAEGRRMENETMQSLVRLFNDSQPNRMTDLKPRKIALMR